MMRCENSGPDTRPSGWEHFDHDADMGIAARASTLEALFEQMAHGLVAIITDAPIADATPVRIHCEAPDPEFLLVDWLNALIYEMATRRMLFGRFDVTISPAEDGYQLEATAWGEPVDVTRHHPAVEVKGATYTALAVAPHPEGGWTARCVVDV